MKITEKEVGYVAKLARIEFDQDEITEFTSGFQNIITYFDKLDELETSNVEAKSEVLDLNNVFREDSVTSSFDRKDIIMNAPTHDDTYIVVPNVVE